MRLEFIVFVITMSLSFSPFTLAAYEDMEGSHMMMEGSHSDVDVITILIKPTEKGSNISGRVTFQETSQGLKINVEISGVPAGKHGIHIHENGSCENKGNAAGGHFNPDSVPHGDLAKNGFAHAHAGDLGNIEIGADGTGKFEETIPGLTLREGSKYSVAGRALILHEKEDNFGQPTGNAGGRIACAVISPTVD